MAAISETKRLEPSTLTLYTGFVKRRVQKKICHNIIYHTTLSDIEKAILQNGGHFQGNTSISETKRRRTFNVDSMYRFWGGGVDSRIFFAEFIIPLYPPFWKPFYKKWRPFST